MPPSTHPLATLAYLRTPVIAFTRFTLSSAEAFCVLTFVTSCAYQCVQPRPTDRSKNRIYSPPLGAQCNQERRSLVFFTHPEYSVVLRALTEDSQMVVEAVKKSPEKNFETGSTSYEWFTKENWN
jgi:hypothetical protein